MGEGPGCEKKKMGRPYKEKKCMKRHARSERGERFVGEGETGLCTKTNKWL